VTPDAIVVGLGAMGSATAYHLARRGQRVLGFDAFPRGHTQGSSHGESRIIRLAYFEHPNYVPLLRRAYAVWDATQHEARRELLRMTGGVFVGRPGSALVDGSLLSARTHHLPHELLDPDQIRGRVPVFRPHPDEVAVYESSAGVLFPERCIEAHLDLATWGGADLRHGEPVQGWTATSNGVEVRTASGRYAADRLVLTAGAWLSKLLPDLPLAPERIPVTWFQPRREPERFTADRFPVFIWDTGVEVFYGSPHLDWPGVKVGRHHQGQLCDPDTVERTATDTDEAPLRAFVRDRIPDLDGPTASRVVCLYTNTPDEHFLIDHHPTWPNVVFAGGFSGHGFKFASVVGEILADLVTTGRTAPEAAFLGSARFARTS
jgi:sarcosine oxidase